MRKHTVTYDRFIDNPSSLGLMLAAIQPPGSISSGKKLFAAVDIGTNSFKLTVVRVHTSSGLFLTLNHFKEPVILGLDSTSESSSISAASIERSISALGKFQNFVNSHCVTPNNLRLVATSAVREADNKSQFISAVNESLHLNVEVLSGDQEARLIYLGVLQFYPVFSSTVLTIDIGGGSTEFTVGFKGNVLFSKSLRLGHVTLTQQFTDSTEMRNYVRNELRSCGLIEKIKEFNIDVVIGTSGTIKAIDRAAFYGYAEMELENLGMLFDECFIREWKFNRVELRCLANRLCDEDGVIERRQSFFKSRAPFILAGTVLLDEIFESLEIEEVNVAGYALGEGVITEMLGQALEGFDLSANARWRSVSMLSSRFNTRKRMQAATMCVCIAREVFEGLRKSMPVSLDNRDFEYLEAACLLHNIGLYGGKKGYHKLSCRLVMNGDQLHGYTDEEMKKIGLLVRHHRKKFPKSNHLEGKENQKFVILCTILRVAVAVQQSLSMNFQIEEFQHTPEGFKLALRDESPLPGGIGKTLEKELIHFRKVFKEDLFIVCNSPQPEL